jgi:hypothetical protein
MFLYLSTSCSQKFQSVENVDVTVLCAENWKSLMIHNPCTNISLESLDREQSETVLNIVECFNVFLGLWKSVLPKMTKTWDNLLPLSRFEMGIPLTLITWPVWLARKTIRWQKKAALTTVDVLQLTEDYRVSQFVSLVRICTAVTICLEKTYVFTWRPRAPKPEKTQTALQFPFRLFRWLWRG